MVFKRNVSHTHDFAALLDWMTKLIIVTLEKWYSSGTDILMERFPSLGATPSILIAVASVGARRLSRTGDLDFLGGCTPFSSRVRSSGTSLFESMYLIMLLFVSAMKSLPVEE